LESSEDVCVESPGWGHGKLKLEANRGQDTFEEMMIEERMRQVIQKQSISLTGVKRRDSRLSGCNCRGK